MEIELRRFSGYRIRFTEPKQQNYHWAQLQQKVAPLAALIDLARKERHYLDDMFGGYTSEQLLFQALKDGEVFACLADGELHAISILRDIVHERHAYMESYALPERRGKRPIALFVRDFMEYAFKEFDQGGLGLKKVKAEVNENNRTALKACARIGFKLIGISPCETLCQGMPENMVLLEAYNPNYFGMPSIAGDKIEHAILSETAGDADLRTASAVHSAGGPAENSPASADADAGNEPRRRRRGNAAAVAPAAKRPDESRRSKRVRK